MKIVQRYTWEDALIEAQVNGVIKNGALLVALKLARAINWEPGGHRKGQPSGLYWKNEEALRAVGASRTAYFDHRKALFDAGFFTEANGNLIPTLPESVVRTEESVVRTKESVVRTEKSVVRNPYSEDTYTEDLDSEDVLSVADSSLEGSGGSDSILLNNEVNTASSLITTNTPLPNDSEEDTPQSVVRTEDRYTYGNRPTGPVMSMAEKRLLRNQKMKEEREGTN